MTDKDIMFNLLSIIMVFIYVWKAASAVPVSEIGTSLNQTNEDMENRIFNQLTFSPVSREDWGARPPRHVTPLKIPVPYVVIHHTYIPAACNTTAKCSGAMRAMQNYHQNTHGWDDIGYNFCVGGDGRAYVGRGWTDMGAHALHFNAVSIGICLIGDWTKDLPPSYQTDMTHDAIAFGVQHGYIAKDYKLVGHRQVRATLCPGDALFEDIQTWPHFSKYPSGPEHVHEVLDQIENQRGS